MGDNNTVSMTINGKRTMSLPLVMNSVRSRRARRSVRPSATASTSPGTKEACSEGACGCCTVIINGDAVASCITLTVECDGAEITTIEGTPGPRDQRARPHPAGLSSTSTPSSAAYCTPGIIMATRALFNHNPHPTREEIAEALSAATTAAASASIMFSTPLRSSLRKEKKHEHS